MRQIPFSPPEAFCCLRASSSDIRAFRYTYFGTAEYCLSFRGQIPHVCFQLQHTGFQRSCRWIQDNSFCNFPILPHLFWGKVARITVEVGFCCPTAEGRPSAKHKNPAVFAAGFLWKKREGENLECGAVYGLILQRTDRKVVNEPRKLCEQIQNVLWTGGFNTRIWFLV